MASNNKTQAKTAATGHEFDPTISNVRDINFPIDTMGVTGKIRTEFRSAVQRCGHSKEKFDTLLDTLEVLSAWAAVKHKEAVEAHEKLMAENRARAEQAARNAVFQEMVKAGDTIHMKADKADEFWEVSPRNGAVLVVHN
ncbi:MAG: hypothetical protein AAFV74_13755 [Pseudomonadota bacterium]